MATPSKRKQQSISIETKRKIIDESEAGKSYGKLTREYELPRSTVQTIVENKAKILEAIDSGIGPKRARLTTAKNPELEDSFKFEREEIETPLKKRSLKLQSWKFKLLSFKLLFMMN
uniref:HTH psq-type domain-containing protein n=1 Tax=Acrobeloides nanus TaxID=290746 RepID=A0A914DN42_9BILA